LVDNDFNLNIPLYVDTCEEEEEIDLAAVKKEIAGLEKERVVVRAKNGPVFEGVGAVNPQITQFCTEGFWNAGIKVENHFSQLGKMVASASGYCPALIMANSPQLEAAHGSFESRKE
jgi:hypothetical protein